MDSDDFDDDIADEDLMNALTQASQSRPSVDLTLSSNHDAPNAPSRTWVSNTDTLIDLDGLDDFPSDAFQSSPAQSTELASASYSASSRPQKPAQGQKANSSQAYRQTNLWGNAVLETEAPRSQVQSRRVYRADTQSEPPTHHVLDHDALKTWIYPTNLGPTRDYQFSIVKNGLFNNTLVALPTGLGKTFIAATIMLNYFRWTKSAKIIFVAPTKPLAAQQVEACMNVAGIPRSQATLLTGEISPALREGEWDKRRLFFMTPQTLQNDLSKGYADPKSVVLLVIDEAHRATGDYAYVKVVEFIRRFNPSFRILALTATPGSKVETVQAVIDSLGISTVEIRMEESIDIRQYVHSREVDQVVLEPSDEMLQVQDLFSKALKPLCNKLAQANKWVARDPMSMTVMGLRESSRQWGLGAGKHANPGTKFMMINIFTILQSLAHAIKLLNFHGIAPFYHKMLDFRSETEAKGSKGSKYKRQVLEDASFQEMMDTIDKWQRLDGFVGHPKLSYLCETLLNHFLDAGQDANTRAIVFSEYRDSAEEIVRTLNKHKPMIKASIFVGQADSKRSEGMKQKQQTETIERFKNGYFNVLVATSIGEEGLDIGQVDLIVCYDASASPIRMLQRMGRTGRKRAGNITLLLMKGREEEQFRKAKDNYEKMQRFICEGTRFNFRNDLSSRIVPRDIKPEVDMRLVEIPIENTQNRALPEPKKATASRKKATQKKFHMPDGVVTGFVKASNFGRSATGAKPRSRQPVEADTLAEVPDLNAVLLDPLQMDELNDTYRNLPSKHASQEDILGPELTGHPKAQRKLGPSIRLQHGRHTKRCVRLFKRLANSQSPVDLYHEPYGDADKSLYTELSVPGFAEDTDGEAEDPEAIGASSHKRALSPPDSKKPSHLKRRKCGRKTNDAPRQGFEGTTHIDHDGEDDGDSDPFADEDTERNRFRTVSERSRSSFKSKGRAGKRQTNTDFVEDHGDDCTRTSQLYERDDSDDGADLLNFVVGDDDPISSVRGTSTPPTAASPSLLSQMSEPPGKKRVSYGFLPPSQSQASDEDMPSMSQMGGRNTNKPRGRRPQLSDSDGEDGDIQTRQPGNKRRRPTIRNSETESE
ncbi:3'-5' DNA helicase [Diaporthe australafricana]|uniref:ATP-dependent DNA helicase n=1 Tax=Diaporthe australafricana TaxID=127596 RepID=A0ABR3WYD4_9PEZI